METYWETAVSTPPKKRTKKHSSVKNSLKLTLYSIYQKTIIEFNNINIFIKNNTQITLLAQPATFNKLCII